MNLHCRCGQGKSSPMTILKLRDWRRRRVLRRSRLDPALWRRTVERLAVLHGLDESELARLQDLVVLFLHEKSLESAHGLRLDPAMKLHIAALACLPILNLGLDYYRGWRTVVVYPRGFLARHEYMDAAGVVHQVARPLAGEAWERGPVILSWEDVADSGELDGFNVVIHECAHKLDMLDGEDNGLPPLSPPQTVAAWSEVFGAAYGDFCARVERGQDTELDPYAADSPGEFFAVLSEAFFELPDLLWECYPAVYGQLQGFYRQDPLARLGFP